MWKRTMLGCASICILGLATLRAQISDINGIAVVVDDTVITYQSVAADLEPSVALLQDQFRNDAEGFRKRVMQLQRERIEELVERQLILREFKTAGYNLPESIIEEEIKKKTKERFGTRLQLTKSLQAEGITYESYRKTVRERIIVDALRGKNVSSEIVVSPNKIVKYYQDHQADYKLEDRVRLRMIVLNQGRNTPPGLARRMALEIHTKLKDNVPFSELAGVYSESPNRAKGGDYGFVDRNFLRKELSDVAFSLTPGTYSDIIETPDACYLIFVEEKSPAHVRPLVDVRAEIETRLEDLERGRLQKNWIDRLRKKTFVTYY